MVNQIAIIPEAATRIEPLVGLVDGYPDDTHRTRTRTGNEPLEDGREISDHAVALEEELTLEGWVSDFQGPHQPEDAWAAIRKLSKETAVVEVITELGTYPEMIIRMAEANRIGRGMRFRMELKEILRVNVDIGPFGMVIPLPRAVARGRVDLIATYDSINDAFAATAGRSPYDLRNLFAEPVDLNQTGFNTAVFRKAVEAQAAASAVFGATAFRPTLGLQTILGGSARYDFGVRGLRGIGDEGRDLSNILGSRYGP